MFSLKNTIKWVTKTRALRYPLFIIFALAFSFLIYALFFSALYQGKIYPGIKVLGNEISGLTPDEASDLLSQKIKTRSEIIIQGKEQSFEIPLSDLEFSYDLSKTTL